MEGEVKQCSVLEMFPVHRDSSLTLHISVCDMSWIDRSSLRGSGLSDSRAVGVRARFLCELHALGGVYAPAHSILTYITCSQYYLIDKIVVGSCPYPQHIVPPSDLQVHRLMTVPTHPQPASSLCTLKMVRLQLRH